MAIFKGFKPEAMNKIAKAMGYQGNMNEFQSFLEEDPQRHLNVVKNKLSGWHGVVHCQLEYKTARYEA